jgi:hypothetical protein
MFNMEKYVEILSDFFSEIIYVDDNSTTIEKTDVFKKNGEIKKIHKKEEIILTEKITIDKETKNLINPECKSAGILDLIRKNSKSVDLNFYPKNIIQRIFKNKEEIEETFRLPNNYFIIASPKNSESIKKYTNNKIYIIDDCDEFGKCKLENYIIVGRSSKIIINKNIQTEYEFDSISLFLKLKYDDFYSINLH